MVGKIIKDYMGGGNKKLTVPGFGTFMRKDSGQIIFVDLLRKDDSVLLHLVRDYGNYSEVEAMALVDRFIFQTKDSIEKNGSTTIDGFGTMYLDEKGLYQLDHRLAAEKPTEKIPVPQYPQPAKAAPPAAKSVGNTPAGTHKAGDRLRPEPRGLPERPARRTRGKSRRSKPDTLIIIALAAAAIAVAIMIFGLSAGNLPFLK